MRPVPARLAHLRTRLSDSIPYQGNSSSRKNAKNAMAFTSGSGPRIVVLSRTRWRICLLDAYSGWWAWGRDLTPLIFRCLNNRIKGPGSRLNVSGSHVSALIFLIVVARADGKQRANSWIVLSSLNETAQLKPTRASLGLVRQA